MMLVHCMTTKEQFFARWETICRFMYPMMLEMAQKVVKSADNITIRSCETSQPGSLS